MDFYSGAIVHLDGRGTSFAAFFSHNHPSDSVHGALDRLNADFDVHGLEVIFDHLKQPIYTINQKKSKQ
jgi:hypothetical protein